MGRSAITAVLGSAHFFCGSRRTFRTCTFILARMGPSEVPICTGAAFMDTDDPVEVAPSAALSAPTLLVVVATPLTKVPPTGKPMLAPELGTGAGATKLLPGDGATKLLPGGGATKLLPEDGATKLEPGAGATKLAPLELGKGDATQGPPIIGALMLAPRLVGDEGGGSKEPPAVVVPMYVTVLPLLVPMGVATGIWKVLGPDPFVPLRLLTVLTRTEAPRSCIIIFPPDGAPTGSPA